MDIIIPTSGRSGQQPTMLALRDAGLEPILVVQDQEYTTYMNAWPDARIYALPAGITTIAPTRDHILLHVGGHQNICMIDDDLVFYRRRTDDPTKLTGILPDELEKAFVQMETLLLDYAHVGFAAREGANRDTEQFILNTRIMRVLGYNREVLLNERIGFNRMQVMEDFDVALQLLEKGHENIVMNHFAHNQAGSGRAGGCSAFRTPQMQADNARLLAALHPGVVRVVEKTTKGAWGGGTRIDVNIQWKKAYNGH